MQSINVDGTANVLSACQQNKVRRLVHMSSVVAVGASFDGRQPLNEDDHYNIGHLNLGYFETKRQAEQLVIAAAKQGLVDAVCVNPSTIYGAGDATKGSRKIQFKVASGKFPFYTAGGVSVVPIEDVIQGTLAAWKVGRTGERYILSGENLTIKEVFSTIAELAGAKPPNIYLPNAVVKTVGCIGDVLEKLGRKGPLNSESAWTAILYHWFDHSKAKKELGFRPGPARDALKQSINWIKKQGWLK
jgi:dihydroflavonol-4-reductase